MDGCDLQDGAIFPMGLQGMVIKMDGTNFNL